MAKRHDERLQAQLEYLRSDDRLRELAALAAEMSAEERLEQAWEMSRGVAAALDALDPDERDRVESTRDVPPEEAAGVLARLARLASPGRP